VNFDDPLNDRQSDSCSSISLVELLKESKYFSEVLRCDTDSVVFNKDDHSFRGRVVSDTDAQPDSVV